jgi:hypothetical protein
MIGTSGDSKGSHSHVIPDSTSDGFSCQRAGDKRIASHRALWLLYIKNHREIFSLSIG